MSEYSKHISVDLSKSGIKELNKALIKHGKELDKKCDELCKRLAQMGAVKASLNFSNVIYTGDEDHTIRVVHKEHNCYAVEARGKTVLFVEFGTGIRYGYGHPEPHEYGAGTYPGKGHWDDPKGWYLPKNKQGKSSGKRQTADKSVHTYGNPPNMPMYRSMKDVERELERVVSEVFK